MSNTQSTAEQIAEAKQCADDMRIDGMYKTPRCVELLYLADYCAELVEASTVLAKKAQDYYEGTGIADIEAMKVLGIVAKDPSSVNEEIHAALRRIVERWREMRPPTFIQYPE